MRKSTAVKLVLLAVSAAALFLVLHFSGSIGRNCGTLQSQMVSLDALAALCNDKTEDPALVDSISFDCWDLFRAGDTWYWSVPEGQTQPYAPEICVCGKGAPEIAFQQTVTDEAFLASGTGIPFVIYTDNSFCRGTLQITTLPLISITVTQPGSTDIESFDDVHIRFSMLDNRACASEHRLVSSTATARVHGSSSASLPKKSIRLSFSEISPGNNDRKRSMDLLGLRSDDDWILYAAAGDPEKVRNAFCNELWSTGCAADNEFGVAAGIRGAWTELIVNGDYRGVYWLTFPLDSLQLSLDSNDFYYRGDSYIDTDAKMLEEASGSETVVGGWEFRGPKENPAVGAARWSALAGYFHAIWDGADTLNLWTDEHTYLPNLIDYYLFVNLINGKDNYSKNLNLVFYTEQDGTSVCLFVPWDMDLTWGNQYAPESDWHIRPYAHPTDDRFLARSLLIPTLRTLREDINAQYLARWQVLRSGAWSDDALNAKLDTYEQQLFGSGAMERESSRWPTEPLAENLDTFRAYVLARTAFIDQTIGEVEPQ